MALSCYHIGPLECIGKTYERLIDYAEEHKYDLKMNVMRDMLLTTGLLKI